MQALRQEGVRRAEGTSQLQDWNLECKDLESRRKTGKKKKIALCGGIVLAEALDLSSDRILNE